MLYGFTSTSPNDSRSVVILRALDRERELVEVAGDRLSLDRGTDNLVFSRPMATLHIEHRITDFATWKAAFDRFAPKRAEAGVLQHRIYQPTDDPEFVVLQLDFTTIEQARAFLGFLEQRVWSTPANSPALAGSPIARVLVQCA